MFTQMAKMVDSERQFRCPKTITFSCSREKPGLALGRRTQDNAWGRYLTTRKYSVPLFHAKGCNNVPTAGLSALYIMPFPA